MRLYADNAKCSGCRACLVACSLHLFGENNPKKAALAIVPHFPAPGTFEVKVCTQCGECAAVCPVDACPEGGCFHPPGHRTRLGVRPVRRVRGRVRPHRIVDCRLTEGGEGRCMAIPDVFYV